MELGLINASLKEVETFNVLNGTTSQPVPDTPPPPGFYGDTRVLLMKIVTPIIITWGTFGNILTIQVLLGQMKKISSTSMYLLALAVSDLCLLWTSPFRGWMKYMWDLDLRYLTDAGCKIHLYFSYTFIHFSSWILVAVTLERAIGVIAPHKVKLCCTSRNAGMVIVCIFVIIFGIDLVIPIISSIDGYQPLEGQAPVLCAPSTKEFTAFRDNIWLWMDLTLSFLLPFSCLFIGNVSIVWHLHKARNIQRKCTMSTSKGKVGYRRRRSMLSVSVLMVALCLIFFLTMTPVAVFQIYYPYRHEQIIEMFYVDPFAAWESYQYLLLQHDIVNLISYTNAAFNFILYVFSGTKFRAELKAVLCHSSKRQNTSTLFESSKQSMTKMHSKSIIINNLKTTLPERKSTSYEQIISGSLEKIKRNNVDSYHNTLYPSKGEDNLVFTTDDGISSLSSIFAKHVDKDSDIEYSDIDDNNESTDDVFADYEIIFSGDPKYDIKIGGKEMNGFILHL
ncbi:cysteinyl leukotriene receptor 2-like [Ruditapes philippinarum]|uniref:cysteinyl leukotriene receptor 2-like n=1 Tax=Ruditapes philippinarum TaxID=129788 RepID=UPI00295A94D5|nr:cysteinyl leukotriene receptor 2-like [Ruditapes philippinarum]